MAASRTNLRQVFQRREKITSLPLYYDGVLWKKSSKDKTFQRYWSELRGSSIFFYCDEKESMYTERLDLQNFVSIGDDNSGGKNSQAASFQLQLINEQVKLKAENVETREEWKGYITVVSQLDIPRDLTLLPGQMLCLEEVVKQEKLRQSSAPVRPELQRFLVEKPDSEFYDDVLTSMPARVIKHYKVTCEDNGFVIWVNYPVTCKSLQEVIDHFIKETSGALKPYIESDVYADKIDVSKNPNDKTNKKLVPMSRVTPIQCPPVLPSEHPGIQGIMKSPSKSPQKLPLRPAEMSSRSPANMEPEPSYMNDEFHLKMNQMVIADDRPPTRTPPKPLSWRFATGGGGSDELMAKLNERRARLGED
ncbi:signal-transducing adaptor protein 1-like isoform X3 [Stegostoma tigrinum]|uniref:signal-transducing adaptor protein 1-like isoform X3 n=1 Tax=Stegostoma tigrinum TaxID=3053191 RepID=UPI00286FD8D2|nr:signal-transducing adaptor protein 1-like isoform X3 [Stegostoma tigrinum]